MVHASQPAAVPARQTLIFRPCALLPPCRFGFSSIRVKFKPTSADLQTCEQSGRDLALAVKKKLKSKELSVAGRGCWSAVTGCMLWCVWCVGEQGGGGTAGVLCDG
jgi:hypothetical protein